MDDLWEYPWSHYRPADLWFGAENPQQCTALSKRLGRSGSPHRLALLCRLRRQDVCPPHQQWQADFSIYLFQLYQSSVWDTMPYTTPYQWECCSDIGFWHAPGYRWIFQKWPDGIYSHRSGNAGCSTECRYIEKAQTSGCCPKESRRTGKTDLQNLWGQRPRQAAGCTI